MIPLRDTIPSRTFPFITYSLIVTNIAVFIHMLEMPQPHLESFLDIWGTIPGWLTHTVNITHTGVANAGFLTLFTAMFLHGGWLHIIGNMWCLFIFGDNVEDRLGHFRFLIFYLCAGIASQITHVILNSGSTIPTIGASGAIAGVMGAYFVLFPHSQILVLIPIFIFPLFIEIPAVIYLFLWFLIQFYNGVFSIQPGAQGYGGIAFWAHVGGFVAGIFLLAIFLKPSPPKRTRSISR